MKKIVPVLLIISFLYIFLLTVGIPFYWQDYINIIKLSGEWQHDFLTYGFESAFRPLENTIYFSFFHIFGVIDAPFRILKAIATVGVVLFIYFFVEKNTGEKKIACFASFFYLTLTAVLQSVMLIYDFEIIVQAFLLIALYYFFRAWEKEEPEWKELCLFILFVYLALLTKESAKIFVGIITIFILFHLIVLQNWKKLKYFAIPLLITLFLAANPGTLIGLKNPSSFSFLQMVFNWFKIDNLLFFLKYMVISSFSILLTLVILFFCILFDRRHEWKNVALTLHGFKQIFEKEENQKLLLFGLWFLVTAALTVLTPLDRRYAIVSLLPFTLFSFISIGRTYKQYILPKKRLFAFLLMLLFLTFAINITMNLKYRYGFGNFFIALDESHTFTEENYENATFLYTDTTAHYYFRLSKTNNQYLEYYNWNRSEQNKNIFFFAVHTPLQTNEKNKATLEKTFVKGPQCFQFYGLQEKEIKEVSLEKTTEYEEEQEWAYFFPEETTISYCSIIVDARFLIPEDIEMTIVGETRNGTETLSVPIGKQISCEYRCSLSEEDANKREKVLGIQLKSKNRFLNEFSSAKLHWIEEE